MSQHGHHDWYVLVKIKDQEDMSANALEALSAEVASDLDPIDFETTHVVTVNNSGSLIHPSWSRKRKAGTGRIIRD